MRAVIVIVVVALLGSRGSVRPAPAGPFVGDERFHQPLTLAVKERPLDDLLQSLRRSHGLPVAADTWTRDERVTVFCRERPAAEILAAIARQFDYTWIRRPGQAIEFVLTQTRTQRDHEAQRRAIEDAERWSTLRKRLAQRVAEGKKSPEQRRRDRIEWAHKALEKAATPEERAEREVRLKDEEQGTYYHATPAYEEELFNGALAAMSEGDWSRFWQGEPYRFGYPAAQGRAAISEAQALLMARTAVEWASHRTEPDGYNVPGTFERIEILRGEISLERDEDRPVVRFRCRLLSRQPGLEALTLEGVQEDGHLHVWEVDENGGVVDPDDLELQRQVQLAADPGAAPPGGNWTMADLLERLSRTVPYTLIADGYDPLIYGDLPEGKQRLDRWLNTWCSRPGEEVRRDGRILYFRRRAWASLRPLQVPDRVARVWRSEYLRNGVLSLSTLMSIATRLTDKQANRLAQRWRWRGGVPEGYWWLLLRNVNRDRLRALRLLATLQPAERFRLLGRGACPIAGRPDQLAALRNWATHFRGGGSMSAVPDGTASFGPSLAVQLELDERRPQLPLPAWIILRSRPTRLWIGTDYSQDMGLEEALAEERETDPDVKPEDLKLFKATEWTVELRPRPADILAFPVVSLVTLEASTQKHPARPAATGTGGGMTR